MKYKVINESEQYSLQVYEINYKEKLPSKYWEGYEKFYPALKNGDIGTIDFEFNHPNGLSLVILKVDGFEDKYKVIAKNALGNLVDEEKPQPKIEWLNFQDSTNNLEVVLNGKIIANGKVVEFKLNQENVTLNGQNEFSYILQLYPGRNTISYYIATETKTAVADYFVIENTSNMPNDIYKNLFTNNFLNFSKDTVKQKEEIEQVKRSLKDGYFYPPNFETYYDIEIDYLVEDGFKTYLIEISNGLKKRGCKAEIGNEYQSWNSEKTPDSKNNNQVHWIEFNGKKEIIWQGNQRDKTCYEIYLKKIVEIVNTALEESKREERVYQFTSYDGVFICLLTDKQYLLLKEICKPLKNRFIN